MATDMSQVDAFGAPRCRTWEDYRKGALMTYRGGYEGDEARAFCGGMETIFNLLEAEFPPAQMCKAAPDLVGAMKEAHTLFGLQLTERDDIEGIRAAMKALIDRAEAK